MVIRSVNPEYKTYERSAEEVHVVGRVVWTSRRLQGRGAPGQFTHCAGNTTSTSLVAAAMSSESPL